VYRDVKSSDNWQDYDQYKLPVNPWSTFRQDAFNEYFTNPAYLDKIGRKFGSTKMIEDMLGQEMDNAEPPLKDTLLRWARHILTAGSVVRRLAREWAISGSGDSIRYLHGTGSRGRMALLDRVWQGEK